MIRIDSNVPTDVLGVDRDSAFAVGQGFRRHRKERRGQSRDRAILADFPIGAHASTSGASLPTRAPRLYRRHFRDLTLITPETHP